MNDSRFNPVSKHEISQLSVSVSLLVGFEDGADYLDWTVSMLSVDRIVLGGPKLTSD